MTSKIKTHREPVKEVKNNETIFTELLPVKGN